MEGSPTSLMGDDGTGESLGIYKDIEFSWFVRDQLILTVLDFIHTPIQIFETSDIMKFQACAAIVLAAGVPSTYAWGTLGHYTVGYVATNFGMETLATLNPCMTLY
jgi:hypothetical protein